MKHLLKKILFLLVLFVLVVAGYLLYDGYQLYQQALSQTSLNEKIESIRQDHSYVSLSDLPQTYRDAVIAIEDHRFYQHHGIDIISTLRAITVNIKSNSLEQGGSTITQQLAKNLYFTQKKKFSRKIAELFLSFDLEKNYSKDEILEIYVNTIFFGRGGTGIASASQAFFQKDPSDLNDYESTFLAGIPNAPSIYSSERNLRLARERQKQVLNAMVKYQKITQEKADAIYAFDETVSL